MQLIATNLDLPFNADESALKLLLSSYIRIGTEAIHGIRIVRHSLDARDKADIRSVYSVLFEISDEDAKKVASLELKNIGRAPVHREAEPLPRGFSRRMSLHAMAIKSLSLSAENRSPSARRTSKPSSAPARSTRTATSCSARAALGPSPMES